MTGWHALRGWLFWFLFVGGFVALAFVARKYGQVDLFPKRGGSGSEPLRVGGRSLVSRVLDEIVCAVLGATLSNRPSPNYIHPTPQQWLYVLLPISALCALFNISLPAVWAIPAGLGTYVAALAVLIVIERITGGPGVWGRERTAGPLNPVVNGLLILFLVASLLWRIASRAFG